MVAFRIPVLLTTVAAMYCLALTIADAQSIDVSRSVLTQHNDAQRTGWYQAETYLTPSTVTENTFGKVYRFTNLKGMITAQPLYVHGVEIGGTQRNVLYIATNENHIYGFEIKDPVSTSPSEPLITADFPGSSLLPGMLDTTLYNINDNINHPPKKLDACGQTRWKVGISSTPVIDPATGTMYVVYRTGPTVVPTATRPDTYPLGARFWLAALDIRTLKSVQPTVEIKNPPDFAADMEINRPALLLANGIVYVAFGAAVCDQGGNPFYATWKHGSSVVLSPPPPPTAENPAPPPTNPFLGHGWVFAYKASAIAEPPGIFNSTPNSSLGGFWQSGNGLSALGSSIFAMTGNNGDTGLTGSKAPEYAESLLRLNLKDSATPSHGFETPLMMQPGNWSRLDYGDVDLASGGPVVLPNGVVIGGGKQGRLYVVDPIHPDPNDPSRLRQMQPAFQAFYNTWHPETDVCNYDADQDNGPNIHGSPVVWRPGGVDYSIFYGMPEKEYLKGFRAQANGQVDSMPFLTTVESGFRSPDWMPGGFLSISSNGGKDGIVWTISSNNRDVNATYATVIGELNAFDALTLRYLWGDVSNANFVKFVPPTVADGKVFRVSYDNIMDDGSTTGSVIVYGKTTLIGGVLSVPIPAKRFVAAGWDPAPQPWQVADPGAPDPLHPDPDPKHLFVFTSAADGEVIGNSFTAYTPAQGCAPSWRSWFPVSKQAPTGGRFPPVTAVWRPGQRHVDFFMVANDGTVKSGYVEYIQYTLPNTNIKQWKYNWPVNWFQLYPDTGKASPNQPVTAVWRDDNHLDLFMAGTDGNVWSIYFDNGQWFSHWFPLQGGGPKAPPGQPITAVWRPDTTGHLDLFMVAEDGTVSSMYFEGTSWKTGWFGVTAQPEGGKATPGQPVAAVWRDGKADHLDLFVTGVDGHVKSTFFENGWISGWFGLPQDSVTAAAGQPVTAVGRPDGSGHIDLFTVAADGTVMSRAFDNGAWQGWFPVSPDSGSGKAVPGQPVTAVWSDISATHLDLFINGADGHVKSTNLDNGKWLPGWFDL